jgi:hypothetical protein
MNLELPGRLGEPLGRGRYAMLGLALFFVKYNIDRIAAASILGRGWRLGDYFAFATGVLSQEQARSSLWLAALAVPFVAVGVYLTLRRLNSIGWPYWLVLLFFAPYVNLAFFAVLCLWPPREATGQERSASWLDRVVPRNTWGSAAMGIAITAPLGFLLTLLASWKFRDYAWGLFLGLPFALGFVSVTIYSYHGRRSLHGSLGVAAASVGLLGWILFGAAVEGIVCLVMALPIAGTLALLGGAIAYALQATLRGRGVRIETATLLILFVPALMRVEHDLARDPARFKVTTSIEIDAPAERVWRHVISFSDLDAPKEWWFQSGIAYPVRARIQGQGAGAVRYCEFSTGAFVEPIEVWDAPHLLKFRVEQSPPPMHEWSPYGQIDAPHLEGYFRAREGEFRLTALAGGRTLLEGTTWYEHRIWPSWYWRWWSDWMVHRIHERVLRHVGRLAATE